MPGKRIWISRSGPPALLACGLSAILFLQIACGPKKSETGPSAAAEARAVELASAEELPVDRTVFGTGVLAAQDRAALSAKVPGRVQELTVDLGSHVKKGDLLVQIEQSDLLLRKQQSEAALAQARARLGLSIEDEQSAIESASVAREAQAVLGEATRNRDRIRELQKQGIIPEAELESVEAAFQVAANRYEQALHEARTRLAVLQERQAELALIEQQLSDTMIRAPFDGIVERRQTSAGEYLNQGAVVLTLVRVDPIRFRLEVAEKDSSLVKVGQRVTLNVEGTSQQYESRISRLSPVISADNRMLIVEADFPNPDAALRPGAFAKGEIVIDESQTALFVPRSALVTFAGIQKVFTVSEGKAVEKEVKSGRSRGDQVEITTGIKAGEKVVVEPGNLRSGQPVELTRRAS